MRPIKLEIEAFGPFVEKQTIEFDKLSDKGLFLIKGKTGSGKTTIFDAMTFALYGQGSGTLESDKHGRNDIQDWRCDRAKDTDKTSVAFTFSSKGKTYQFIRGTERARINLKNFCSCNEILNDGTADPLMDNPTFTSLTKKAEEIIGLTKEQFVRVVLLPQGQFEKFLTAASADKEKILQQIFDCHKWEKYALKFKEKADNRKDELTRIKEKVDNSLHQEECESFEDLDSKIALLKESKKSADERHKLFDGQKKQENLNADIKCAAEFKPLHDFEAKKAVLQGNIEAIDNLREELRLATEAEGFRVPIKEYEQALSEKNKREKELLKASNDLELKKKKAEDAKSDLAAFEKSVDVPALQKQIGELDSKKTVYVEYDGLCERKDLCVKKKNDAKKILDQAQENASARKKESVDCKKAFDDAESVLKKYRDQYYAGIYGEIAAELVDGEKCPVCGSASHPAPAVKSPDSVSKKDVDSKQKLVDTAKKEWDKAEQVREAAEESLKNADNEYHKLDTEAATAEQKYNSAKANLVDGIATLEELENKLEEISDAIASFIDTLNKKKQAAEDSKNEYTTATATVSSAEDELKKAEKTYFDAKKVLDKKLSDVNCADYKIMKDRLVDSADRDRQNQEIAKYESKVKTIEDSIQSAKKNLAGKTEPDTSKFDARQTEITNEANEYSNKNGRLESEINRLSLLDNTLSTEYKKYSDNIDEAESDCEFAVSLVGSKGIGLSRYVLAIMFDQVICEANRLLEKVHGGRYQLFRTDDKGQGNRRGLELKAHDNRALEEGGRLVGSLSGGEKFLVSLALSIGLSTVAQMSGVRIEALFIDEGFGTLDNNSIDDALLVLEDIRQGKNNATIGIISHVELLEENIPTQIEVVEIDNVNKIVML